MPLPSSRRLHQVLQRSSRQQLQAQVARSCRKVSPKGRRQPLQWTRSSRWWQLALEGEQEQGAGLPSTAEEREAGAHSAAGEQGPCVPSAAEEREAGVPSTEGELEAEALEGPSPETEGNTAAAETAAQLQRNGWHLAPAGAVEDAADPIPCANGHQAGTKAEKADNLVVANGKQADVAVQAATNGGGGARKRQTDAAKEVVAAGGEAQPAGKKTRR